mmetsp:Transcript_18921/g.29612  ORF Transcript_18921/g.29612 Transcript_18921/m.29612 type:complete len:132 (-) Transcript_18921:59-454(-)
MCFYKLFAIILSLFLNNFEKCCSSMPPLSLYNVVHHVLFYRIIRVSLGSLQHDQHYTFQKLDHFFHTTHISWHKLHCCRSNYHACLIGLALELGFGAAIASQSTRHTFSLNRMLNSGYTNERMYSEISVGI